MFSFLKKKEHTHPQLEKQMEFLLMMQVGLLRRFNLNEEEMATIIEDEHFISELYLNRLVSLINEKAKGDQNDIRQ